ncbi:MAG: protein phosphatase 2C domain-containing protein [Pseudomonadota bacterium]
MSLVVESAGLTDVGKKRKNNEDSLFLDDGLGLYVVADGMGGHQAGEVASKIVVDTMGDYLRSVSSDKDAEALPDTNPGLSQEANRLLAAIHLANRSIHQVAEKKDSLHGMGSTVSSVYLAGDDRFVAANVGDSPIYLIHEGGIETISVFHTVIAEQAAINPGAAGQLGEKFAHMLTRAMGAEETVLPDACEIQCYPGDVLVLGSDGLTNRVNEQEILEISTRNRPEAACRALVDLANERGGDDNITVIVLLVKSVGTKPKGLWGLFVRAAKRLFEPI